MAPLPERMGIAMTWTKLPDEFTGDLRVVGLSDAAFRLYVSALVYANRILTDGLVPLAVVPMLTPRYSRKAVGELLAAGLWLTSDSEKGYRIADFNLHQRRKVDVLALREARAKAGHVGGLQSGAGRQTVQANDEASDVANDEPNAEGDASTHGEANANPDLTRTRTRVSQLTDSHSLRKTNGEEDAVVADALEILSSVAPKGTNLPRIRQRLRDFRVERPDVDLSDQVRSWAERARLSPLRNAEAALFAWLAGAQDAPQGKRERRCAVDGCSGRGRGTLGLCPVHTYCAGVGCRAIGTAMRDGVVFCTTHVPTEPAS
jgi:hypothetical protein